MFGPWQITLIVVAIILLFGAKRIPEIAGSLAKGIKEFKKVGAEEDSNTEVTENKTSDDKDKKVS